VDVEARYEEGRVVGCGWKCGGWCGYEYTGKANE